MHAQLARHGTPHLFMTFGFSWEWDEVAKAREQAPNRTLTVDSIATHFNRRRKDFIDYIYSNQYPVGPIATHVGAAHWPLHGLPMFHLCVWLRLPPHEAEEWDDIVCTELPDLNRKSVLFKTVLANSIHLCEDDSCKVPARFDDSIGAIEDTQHARKGQAGIGSDTVCQQGFPFQFEPATRIDPHTGKITTRRRSVDDGGFLSYHTGQLVDNRHVKPHNPALTLRYRSPIVVMPCDDRIAADFVRGHVPGYGKVRVHAAGGGVVLPPSDACGDCRW